MILSAQNVVVAYDDKPLLAPLSILVEAGDCYHIVGKNGIGKSTLLKTLAGLKAPAEGTVKRNSTLNYIGHALGLMDTLTVAENIKFYANLYKTENKLNHAKTSYDLGSIWKKRILHCSRGQKQRVALSRLALNSAPLWILDEVFTNLDSHYESFLQDAMQAHLNEGGAIVLASHQHTLPFSHQVLRLQ